MRDQVGLHLQVDDGEVIVASINSDSVFKDRLLPGQTIQSINGTVLDGHSEKTVPTVVQQLRDASDVEVHVVLPDDDEPPPVCILRDEAQLSLRTRTNLALSNVSHKRPAAGAQDAAAAGGGVASAPRADASKTAGDAVSMLEWTEGALFPLPRGRKAVHLKSSAQLAHSCSYVYTRGLPL